MTVPVSVDNVSGCADALAPLVQAANTRRRHRVLPCALHALTRQFRGVFKMLEIYGEMDRATRKPTELSRRDDILWRLVDRNLKE